ncbi:MAG: hypothetical protein AB1345_09265 [Chloroflexota bacterium]
MRVIDKSPYVNKDGEVSFWGRLFGMLKFSVGWYEEMQAQKEVIEQLDRVLDNKFVMLRNASMPGLELLIPLMLIGPSGVHVLYATPLKGIFRIKGKDFARMDTTTRQFKDVRPNLVKRTLLFSKAVEVTLDRLGYHVPEVEPTLVFTDPGVHIDTSRPDVRVVLVDALERYAFQLVQGRRVLDHLQARAFMEAVLYPRPARERVTPPVSEEPDFLPPGAPQVKVPTAPEPAAVLKPVPESESLSEGMLWEEASPVSARESAGGELERRTAFPGKGRVRFTPRQWIILGAFVVFEVLILLVFMFLIFSS